MDPDQIGRVRLNPDTIVGELIARTTDICIPITQEDGLGTVACIVTHPVAGVRKNFAVQIVSALNDSLNRPEAPPAPVAATEHEDGLTLEALRTRAAALEEGVRAAILKLHRLMSGEGFLDPLKALTMLEDCMARAGVAPPERPAAFTAPGTLRFYVDNGKGEVAQWSSGGEVASSGGEVAQWSSGHDPMKPANADDQNQPPRIRFEVGDDDGGHKPSTDAASEGRKVDDTGEAGS